MGNPEEGFVGFPEPYWVLEAGNLCTASLLPTVAQSWGLCCCLSLCLKGKGAGVPGLVSPNLG